MRGFHHDGLDDRIVNSTERFQNRVIITGHDDDRNAVFKNIQAPEAVHARHMPGFRMARVWATPADLRLPDDHESFRRDLDSLHPAPGESRFMIVTFPPDAITAGEDFIAEAAAAEMRNISPGIAERFEADDPGMHTTDTLDYGIVLFGEIWLELDQGRVEHLTAGDVVVQNATRHAWRNRGSEAAIMAFVMLGGRRT